MKKYFVVALMYTTVMGALLWQHSQPKPVISPDPDALLPYIKMKSTLRHGRAVPYFLRREVQETVTAQPQTPSYQNTSVNFTRLCLNNGDPDECMFDLVGIGIATSGAFSVGGALSARASGSVSVGTPGQEYINLSATNGIIDTRAYVTAETGSSANNAYGLLICGPNYYARIGAQCGSGGTSPANSLDFYAVAGNIQWYIDGTTGALTANGNKNLVPSATGNGSLGLSSLQWSDIRSNASTISGQSTSATFVSTGTSPQYLCASANCGLASQSTFNMTVDTGGGTSTASLGAANATTTTVGRSGQTTNINGNVTFGTAGPNLGSALTGTWTPFAPGLLVASTNYGGFQISQSITNVKFRNVTCSHRVAGTSTNGTLAVRNVTDSTTLCSGSYTCTTTANTPALVFDCNTAPVTGKNYAINFTTGCGGTQVTDMGCTIEIAH